MTKWTFKEQLPDYVMREPSEDEFFTGEEEDEGTFARTDPLVREAIQNSLDARWGSSSVRVRFNISAPAEVLSEKESSVFLDGLMPHLEACGFERSLGAMNYLVIEDFGTRGLCGDPRRRKQPSVESATDPEDWYWFWWRVGKSGKSGGDRGRWGLGRSVFAATSKIRTFFAYTVRQTDGKKLLMGQAKLGGHELDERTVVPEGFFHDSQVDAQLQVPFSEPGMIRNFEDRFKLLRGQHAGLSIVVPFPFETLTAIEIVRSVILHYFYPILRGDLVVEVSGPGMGSTMIGADTIQAVAESLDWGRSRREKLVPPFELAKWAIGQQASGIQEVFALAGTDRVPDWNDLPIAPEMVDRMRAKFDSGERLSVRVPMTIEKKSGEVVGSHFDIFFERDPQVERAEDFYIRGGMTISKISTLSAQRGIRGIVVVEDKPLSKLLGDAEGPAHTEWGTGEARPDRDYVRWKKRIAFVKNSLLKVIGLLSLPPEGLDENLLADIFSVADPLRRGRIKKRGRKPKVDGPQPPLPPLPPLPPPSNPPFVVTSCESGFRIRSGSEDKLLKGIRVRVAYELPVGNPLKSWSAIDFEFDEHPENPIKFSYAGALVEKRKKNSFEIRVEEPAFDVEVIGFDTERGDLMVKAELISGEDTGGEE